MESPGLSEVRRQIPFLGLGLYWAWVTVVFYSDALVPASPDGNGLVETIWLWATWSHMIALFVFAALSRKLGSLLSRRSFRLVGVGGTALGSALITLISVIVPSASLSQTLILVVSVFVGICSAWHVLQWAELYARGLGNAVTPLSLLSFVLGIAIYFLLMAFPPVITTIMAVLLPLFAGMALYACHARKTSGALRAHSTSDTEFAGGLAVSLLAVFVFALCGEMLRVLTLRISEQSVVAMGSYYLLGGLIGLVALATYFLLPVRSHERRITLPLVRNVLLFMAAAFFAAPFLGSYAIAVSYGIFGAGFWCFRAISWVFCFVLVFRLGYDPVRVIAVLDGVFALSVVVSSQLNLWIAESIKVGGTELTTVALVAVFALMLMAIFVLNGKGVSKLLRMGFEDSDSQAVDPHEAADEAAEYDGDIETALARLANDYNLSPRETEVAALLAKGRSLPFIQNELYISAGTAQTHARHIYKKLNVHSRQEFLDVVEKARVSSAH